MGLSTHWKWQRAWLALVAVAVGLGFLFQAIWDYDDVENRSSRRLRTQRAGVPARIGAKTPSENGACRTSRRRRARTRADARL